MQKNSTTSHTKQEQELKQLRALILGEKCHQVTDPVKKDARNIVGDVLSEALHDRQKKDGSVNKVLQPLVEESVQQSVIHHSDRLVSSLYPLMGNLVRKYVAAFVTNFLEKTNQLIENSLTIKGIKWRFKAWRSGVTFAQYVISQTFSYRVEHVFLIHRETGLLLNAVDLNPQEKSDADLISAMLVAINDFVGDSFLANKDSLKEQLQTVTTDNFKLLIKTGPSALIVAAVIGNPPQEVNDQLQLTLEDVHRLYFEDLSHFDGDNKPFENSENLLRDCLLSKQKTADKKKKKTPWFSLALLTITIMLSIYYLIGWYKNQQLTQQVMRLDQQPGIIIKRLNITSNSHIELDIMRDPDAIPINDWFETQGLSSHSKSITERHFVSLAPKLLAARAKRLLASYPKITAHWQKNVLHLSGELSPLRIEALTTALSIAGITDKHNLNTQQLNTVLLPEISNNTTVKQHLFTDIVSKISSIQLDFQVSSADINASQHHKLAQLYQYLNQLQRLSIELDINFGLIVLGTSDNSGNVTVNNQLSALRADNTVDALKRLGFSSNQVYAIGLGEINIPSVANTARRVIFNVMYVN